ncbi:amidohydrolase family-domain-containing protein [Abortiporus biennis]|nr:amidohydrolase family-domain-containing protein [Abortiporus biennis]
MYPTKPPPTLRKRLSDEKRNMEKEGQEPGRLEGRKLFERSNKLTYAAILTIAAIAAIVTTVGNLSDQRIVLGPLPNAYALCFKKASRIITVDKAYPHVQCLAVRDSHFIDVGSLEELSQRWNLTAQSSQTNSSTSHLENTLPLRYIDSPAIIVPGLSDSHVHVLEYGATQQLPLEGTRSPKETVQRVHDYILADPEVYDDKTKFIEGWGWDHTQWLLKEWPNTNEMEEDEVIRGRPVLLQSKDGHAIWVSRTILDGLKDLPAEIEGGVIVRDKSGNPTGVFLDNAQDLVKRPEPSYKTLEKRFAIAVRDAHARGLTAVHDAGFNPRSLEFFRKQADEGKLPIRIYGMTHFNETSSYWGDRVPKIIGAGNHRLSARSVKIFADGALRSGGAALYEPYADNPTTRGFMRTEPEVLNDIIPKFLRDGWQVNVHAIGDRANGVVLDAFEGALKDANVSSLRPRLEHAQILAKKDLARFGDLGVIASVQPTHAISDMWFGEDRLGPERVKGLYAFRSILDHGARITLGSDFPVEDMNPLAGFYAAITRLSPDGKSPHGPGGWFPEQRMTREEALQGMTLDPAYASFSEDILGSITIGKRADFVVFSQDIMNAPTQKILETKVLATVIDGQVVYGGI